MRVRYPVTSDTEVICLDESDYNSTIHEPTNPWVEFLTLCREADGNTFQCCLCLDTEKAMHQDNKGSEVRNLFEAVIEILLFLLLIRGFQALLRFLGMLGDEISIQDPHVVNSVRPLHPEVFDEEIPLQLSLVLRRGPFELVLPYMNSATYVDFGVVTHVCGDQVIYIFLFTTLYE